MGERGRVHSALVASRKDRTLNGLCKISRFLRGHMTCCVNARARFRTAAISGLFAWPSGLLFSACFALHHDDGKDAYEPPLSLLVHTSHHLPLPSFTTPVLAVERSNSVPRSAGHDNLYGDRTDVHVPSRSARHQAIKPSSRPPVDDGSKNGPTHQDLPRSQAHPILSTPRYPSPSASNG